MPEPDRTTDADDEPPIVPPTIPLGFEQVICDPVALQIVAALTLDPRNPHLYPAIVDYCERAEYIGFAKAMRENREFFMVKLLALRGMNRDGGLK